MALVIAAFAVQPEQGGAAEGADAQAEKQAQPEADAKIEEKFVYVEMKTTLGEIYLELNNELAPISTENFVTYANDKYYDGTIFHRVISNFMIQGGGFDKDLEKKKTRDGIENEWKNGLSNMRGTVAMARLGNRPNSATGQFFINVADNAFLDQPRDGAGYAVFAKVVKGIEVVDKIRAVPTTTKGPYGDVPVENVVIEKVTVLDAAKAEELGLVEVDG